MVVLWVRSVIEKWYFKAESLLWFKREGPLPRMLYGGLNSLGRLGSQSECCITYFWNRSCISHWNKFVKNYAFTRFTSCHFYSIPISLLATYKRISKLDSSQSFTTVRIDRVHNSPICDEYQTQQAWVLALPWKRAHQDDFKWYPTTYMWVSSRFPFTVD